MYETSSEEDGGGNNRTSEDSGVGSIGRDASQPAQKLLSKRVEMKQSSSKKHKLETRVQEKRKKAAMDKATKELVANVVELSVVEVRKEEEHLGALCPSPMIGGTHQIVLAQ